MPDRNQPNQTGSWSCLFVCGTDGISILFMFVVAV